MLFTSREMAVHLGKNVNFLIFKTKLGYMAWE